MPVDVFIASPLEDDLVERIRAGEPRARVGYEPELLPPTRYPSDHRGESGFRRNDADERRWQESIAAAEVLFGAPGDTAEGLASAIRSAPGLRWVQGTAAGAGEQLRQADLSPADLARVTMTSARGVHAEQLAEWAMLGLLAFTKDLPRLLAAKTEHRWEHYPVRELAGQTLLIVGLGEIGREVARSARALRMHTLGVRRSLPEPAVDDAVDELHPIASLPELVPRADAVVLALPDTPATRNLFDRRLVESLGRRAVLVNVGRGRTLDQTALTEALVGRRITGAALEVFETEPLPADDPLWQLDNVLISPHTAALSTKENARIVDLFVTNLRRYCDGEPLLNVVDPTDFY
jgi:phosphoglycerate dehydrogenase-like enzyme